MYRSVQQSDQAVTGTSEVWTMSIVLALGAAAFYGSADFVGAVAARRNAALSVALGAQVSGLVVLLVALPFLGPATVTRPDLVFGALAGVFGGLGVVVVYRTLAKGPMSVVAPNPRIRKPPRTPDFCPLPSRLRCPSPAPCGAGKSFGTKCPTRNGGAPM